MICAAPETGIICNCCFNSIPHAAQLRQCDALMARYMYSHPLRTQILDMPGKSIRYAAPANTFTINGDRLLLNSIPVHKTLLAPGPDRGLPLGSASSQTLAGLFMVPLEQYIKHTLRVKGYVRYMDDLILFGSSTEQLSRYRQAIRYFMQTELKLTLHPHKQTLAWIVGQYPSVHAGYLHHSFSSDSPTGTRGRIKIIIKNKKTKG